MAYSLGSDPVVTFRTVIESPKASIPKSINVSPIPISNLEKNYAVNIKDSLILWCPLNNDEKLVLATQVITVTPTDQQLLKKIVVDRAILRIFFKYWNEVLSCDEQPDELTLTHPAEIVLPLIQLCYQQRVDYPDKMLLELLVLDHEWMGMLPIIENIERKLSTYIYNNKYTCDLHSKINSVCHKYLTFQDKLLAKELVISAIADKVIPTENLELLTIYQKIIQHDIVLEFIKQNTHRF
jgi:hypothetical protein